MTPRSNWRFPAFVGACLLAGLGCSPADDSGFTPPGDAGSGRDAFIHSDASLIQDASVTADAAGNLGRDGATAHRSLCAPEACDPIGLEACDTVRTCRLTDGEPMCAATAGPRHHGDACTATTECGWGLACFAQAPGEGTCLRLCCAGTGDETCGDGERCAGSGRLVDGARTAFGACVPARSCELFEDSPSCGFGESCAIVDASGRTECRTEGTRAEGESCDRQEDCRGGLACTGASTRTCVRLCRLTPRREEERCHGSATRCQSYSYSPAGTGICTPE